MKTNLKVNCPIHLWNWMELGTLVILSHHRTTLIIAIFKVQKKLVNYFKEEILWEILEPKVLKSSRNAQQSKVNS